jgi:DNA replication protein DnaC
MDSSPKRRVTGYLYSWMRSWKPRNSRRVPTCLSWGIYCEAELFERKRRNLEVRIKLACLPSLKRLDKFNFTFQLIIDERLIRKLATMAFVQQNGNLLFLGPAWSWKNPPVKWPW